jgi:hypothetical protein
MRVKRFRELPMTTSYVAAFRRLGYKLPNWRFVSAEKIDGVALAIFRSELAPAMVFDSRDVPNWNEQRCLLPGNAVRKRHIARALKEFEGKVDAILVFGGPGEGRKEAEPWQRPGSHWQVTYFEAVTGHHRVELIRC